MLWSEAVVNVLIIKPSSLGDIIHSFRAVERIARARADCRVTWLVNEEYASFVRELPGVAEVLPFPRRKLGLRRFPWCVPHAARWLADLRRGFDVAVDLQGLQRSGFMARLSGARERFGPRDAREFAWLHYNLPISVPPSLRHAVDRLEYVAAAVCQKSAVLSAWPEKSAGTPVQLPVPAVARREATRILGEDEHRPVLLLCPGTRWSSKLWPASRWAEFLDISAQRCPQLRPIFLGAPGEEALVREILSQTTVAAADLTGKTPVWTTAAVMERAAAVVTMDSAPLHLAAAVGVPTVALFGPTDPERVAPQGRRHRVVRLDLDCLACYERTCPLPRRVCLEDLSAERVVDALAEVLER